MEPQRTPRAQRRDFVFADEDSPPRRATGDHGEGMGGWGRRSCGIGPWYGVVRGCSIDGGICVVPGDSARWRFFVAGPREQESLGFEGSRWALMGVRGLRALGARSQVT